VGILKKIMGIKIKRRTKRLTRDNEVIVNTKSNKIN